MSSKSSNLQLFQIESLQKELNRELGTSIEKSIEQVLGKQKASWGTKLFEDSQKIKNLEAKVVSLERKLAGKSKEADIIRRELTELMQVRITQGQELPNKADRTVPFSVYQESVNTVTFLQERLSKSREERIKEAEARYMLIEKARNAKTTAQEWMEYAKQVKARNPEQNAIENGCLRTPSFNLELPLADTNSKLSEDNNVAMASNSSTTQGSVATDSEVPEQLTNTVSDIVVNDDFVLISEKTIKKRRLEPHPMVKQEWIELGFQDLKAIDALDLDEVGTAQINTKTEELQGNAYKPDTAFENQYRSQSEPLGVQEAPEEIRILIDEAVINTIESDGKDLEIHTNKNSRKRHRSRSLSRQPLSVISHNAQLLSSKSLANLPSSKHVSRKRRSLASHDNRTENVPNDGSTRTRQECNADIKQLLDTSVPTEKLRIPRRSISKRKHPSASITPKPATKIRERPPELLCLADFKLNPALNHGLDHPVADGPTAFATPSCQPGCTDTRCCGPSMRALALSLRPLLPAPSRPDGLTDDARLVRWLQTGAAPDAVQGNGNIIATTTSRHRAAYDAWNRQGLLDFRALGPREQQDLVLAAQTKLVALQFGKHRVAAGGDQRRLTPPGFWDASIPDTQQQARQKEIAEQVEKEEVRMRWREALGRGRWLFRDE